MKNEDQRITVRANIGAYAAYHFHTNETIIQMARMGFYVSVHPIQVSEGMFGSKIPQEVKSRFVQRAQPEPWELVIAPPEIDVTPGKKTIYFTTLESSRLRPDAIEKLKKASAIIVPCSWNASCLSAMGFDCPIFVVNEGVNPDVFRYSPMTTEGPFIFGAGGKLEHGGNRKGIYEVIDAFQAAFTSVENVRLKIKVFKDCNLIKPDDSRIEIITDFLSESGMANFMKSLNCFVSFSRGEGWGLMPNEAMACGRPVLGCLYGGQAEFMDRHNSYAVSYSHANATGFYDGCGTWAEPDMADMVRQMRYAYGNREDVVRRGMVAANDVRHLTWKRTAENTVKVLKLVGALNNEK